ncbi:hypothetical protein NIES4073_60290 [Kalymmatonema gypsitolerans NIES-4073]|nr:hypothetical protein NIES4073_60290 [Scytonema sp. NIES-4073]
MLRLYIAVLVTLLVLSELYCVINRAFTPPALWGTLPDSWGGLGQGSFLSDFSRHVEKPTRNLTPQPPSLKGKGENLKPLPYKGRGLERGQIRIHRTHV